MSYAFGVRIPVCVHAVAAGTGFALTRYTHVMLCEPWLLTCLAVLSAACLLVSASCAFHSILAAMALCRIGYWRYSRVGENQSWITRSRIAHGSSCDTRCRPRICLSHAGKAGMTVARLAWQKARPPRSHSANQNKNDTAWPCLLLAPYGCLCCLSLRCFAFFLF